MGTKLAPQQMGMEMRRVVEDRKDKICRMLPAKLGQDRFMETVLSVVSTPEIAACTPASIVNCVFACAKVGLMPDPILNHIHIIPRNTNIGSKASPNYVLLATIQVGYKGYIELGRRSGGVHSVHTEIAYQGDKFRYWTDENGPHLLHEPNLERDADEAPICVYCVAEMAVGHPQIRVLPWFKVLKAKQDTPAWRNALDEMAMKTAVHRAAKYWPQSPELASVMAWEEQNERGEMQRLPVADDAAVVAVTNGGIRKRSLKSPDVKALPETGPGPNPSALQAGAAAVSPPPPAEGPTEAELDAMASDVELDPRGPADIADEYSSSLPVADLANWLMKLKPAHRQKALDVAGIPTLVDASEENVRIVAYNAKLLELEGGAA